MSENLKVVLLADDICLPTKANSSDAGYDLRSSKDIIIKPLETIIIPTGIKIVIPNGYEGQIRGRSGINAKTKLRVALGTIDSGYRDEVGVIMTNTASRIPDSNTYNLYDIKHKVVSVLEYPYIYRENIEDYSPNVENYYIHKGDRIAQIIFNKVEKVTFNRVNEEYYKENYLNKDNRNGGFGSSGIK